MKPLHILLCALVPSAVLATESGTLEYLMANYQGGTINKAIDGLGFPTREMNVAGRYFVVWERSAVTGDGARLNCTATFEVRQSDKRVTGVEVNGQFGACKQFKKG